MTNANWSMLSDQAIAVAGVVYFLALLTHLVEWASLRDPVSARGEKSVADESGEGSVAVITATDPPADTSHRVAFLGRLGVLLTGVAALVHLLALLGRGMAADPNRVPWGNMYEFTISGTCVLTLMYLAVYRRFKLAWIAPFLIGFVLAVLMAAVIWLHDEVAPLSEALNSPWLVIHVISAVIATGGFTLGGLISAAYLVKLRDTKKRGGEAATGWLARVPSLDSLDRISYRVHAFAFPVWTFAVLITGPIWAHEAWSSYWNWDPKEVWAFITWVVYAGYLHARATAGWRGRNAALLALLGLVTLWFNFIGINYFSSSTQHGYAAAPAPWVQER